MATTYEVRIDLNPEITFSIQEKTTFEALRHADIYSFALVMWEVLRRTEIPGSEAEAESYALPYYLDVGPDPSFEEMRKVVCGDQRRPQVDLKWDKDTVRRSSTAHVQSVPPFLTFPLLQITSGLSRLMQECWHQDPSARLSSLRLKKSIAGLVATEEHTPPSSSFNLKTGFKSYSLYKTPSTTYT